MSSWPVSTAGPVVVVGAGASGCVVAGRLAAAGHDVVLVESGPSSTPSGDDVLGGRDHLAAHRLDVRWHRWTGHRADTGATVDQSTGRGVGGSAAVNGLLAEVDLADPALGGAAERDANAAALHRSPIAVEHAEPGELGVVDRMLLDAGVGDLVPLLTASGRRIDLADRYLAGQDRIELLSDRSVERLAEFDAGVSVELDDGARVDGAAVVLCAGAFATPSILLRSGIGDRVGDHLQDHPAIVLPLVVDRSDTSSPVVTGVVAHRSGVQLVPLDRLGSGPDTAVAEAGLLVAVMDPTGAAGSVRLDDAGGTTISLDPFADADDMRRLRDGVRWALDLIARSSGVAVADERLPALDDASLDDWIRSAPSAHRHAVGTCGVGRTLDTGGLVRGTGRIHVADAAAFARIPRTGTFLPTVIQAERLVDAWTRGKITT